MGGKTVKRVLLCVAATVCLAASAQDGSQEGALSVEPGRSEPEVQALREARRWIEAADPALGNEGSVVFLYGEGMPRIVCAPLFPCTLELERGEVVRQIEVGDAVRWRVTPVMYATSAAETTAVTIKPTDTGLETVLVIATDRRLYQAMLRSDEEDWMPRVAWSYPDEVDAAWAAYYAGQRQVRDERILPGGFDVARLDFGYRLEGERAWAPVRVFSDGARTYLEFAAGLDEREAPALVVMGDGEDGIELVNYRVDGDRYVIDRVVERARLVLGQEHVEILREAER